MSIREFIKGKQIFEYFKAYTAYFLLNYAVCLVPIGVSYYFSTTTLLISSFLAYCFTLLAVTVYSFMYMSKDDVGGMLTANLGIIVVILLMVVYMGVFIMYNSVEAVFHSLNTSILKTVVLTFIPVCGISIVLTRPAIKLQIIADKSKKIMSQMKELEQEGNEVIREIEREGIS